MDKKFMQIISLNDYHCNLIWYYVLSFMIKILCNLLKAIKQCVELLMFTIAIFFFFW
jgi:hypothetical protein